MWRNNRRKVFLGFKRKLTLRFNYRQLKVCIFLVSTLLLELRTKKFLNFLFHVAASLFNVQFMHLNINQLEVAKISGEASQLFTLHSADA